jgi:hypothetical protein
MHDCIFDLSFLYKLNICKTYYQIQENIAKVIRKI